MSATVERNTSAWRKRHREESQSSQMERKKPRYYYYRLESESSKASEEDTESVYSLQDRETDVVRDTSDTDSKSECSDQQEYELIEYEVASLSGSDDGCQGNSSSGSDDQLMIAAAVEAICDSSLETWITDCEDSDNSSLDDSAIARSDFSRCVQCKLENDNPLYRYCEKCFQDRKKFFPPRPRGNRKIRKTFDKKQREPPVKLDTLRSCLSGLSQDSGIGSSQDCPSLDLDQIIVPDEHLRPGTSKISSIREKCELEDVLDKTNTSPAVEESKFVGKGNLSEIRVDSKRKRQASESSLSDFDIKKMKHSQEKPITLSQTSDLGSEISTTSFSSSTTEKSSESSELCIFCNNAPKDSIFLHTNIAHQCCCYKCAKRTLHTIKRCPICNRPVNKVVRIFTS
ncbi:hypothetical protein JTB14_002227 [Gonioctena quinquepunctata]|nr:hypothetical protein JTB14_002227 [Gonioctena quinquepunctata]